MSQSHGAGRWKRQNENQVSWPQALLGSWSRSRGGEWRSWIKGRKFKGGFDRMHVWVCIVETVWASEVEGKTFRPFEVPPALRLSVRVDERARGVWVRSEWMRERKSKGCRERERGNKRRKIMWPFPNSHSWINQNRLFGDRPFPTTSFTPKSTLNGPLDAFS